MALDIGGLSFNKLADQAKKDGNEEGAKQARNLSIALVSVMLIGVIMAGVDQIVKLDGQVATVIDTILLIARAVMAVLYSRVIHGLKKEESDTPQLLSGDADLEAFIAEAVKAAMTEALATTRREMVAQLEQSQSTTWNDLSQRLEECLMLFDKKQMETLMHVKDEQTRVLNETREPICSCPSLEACYMVRPIFSDVISTSRSLTCQQRKQRSNFSTPS